MAGFDLSILQKVRARLERDLPARREKAKGLFRLHPPRLFSTYTFTVAEHTTPSASTIYVLDSHWIESHRYANIAVTTVESHRLPARALTATLRPGAIERSLRSALTRAEG